MPDQPLQNSLFEDDYLLRELGQVAHVPQVALTELVANAWDAGATRVDLILPTETGGTLTVTDNGHGMTPSQFKKRWMTLRYDRLKHQGPNVTFPSGRHARPRRAYGRNGIGRHGLLCFADEYEVQTWCDEVLATFVVGTESGPSPFVWRSETLGQRGGSGTQLSVRVVRKLPDADEILTVLAARFVHDPEFEVRVNGVQRNFDEIEGRVSEEVLHLGAGRSATVIVIDSTQLNHSSVHQGIAFWVQRRLVGSPSWSIGQIASFDGRTRFARRYKVIVDTDGFEPGVDVAEDWTAFRATDAVRDLYRATAEHVGKVVQYLAAEIVEAASEDALVQNRTELASLGQGARLEVAEFTKVVAQAHPAISPDFLATAVKAVIHLEKTKSGAALLQKLSSLPADDIAGLDRLLIELKKGGFELKRKEVDQADGYVQDIAASGAMSGRPFICAWVVGQKIAAGVERDKQLGNPPYGRVRAATFGSLVDTANARLLKLRTVLADRYGGSSTDELLNRVFLRPTQDGLGL